MLDNQGRNIRYLRLSVTDRCIEVPAAEKPDGAAKEAIVEHIAESIRQTAATGSHFSKMLSPEEEEIMREIIREFMKE